MRKLTHQELVGRQSEIRLQRSIPLTVVLNNVRSLHNVGSMFRTADGAGVEKIWLCGITGIPPSPQLSKTALGAERVIPWEYGENARDCISQYKAKGYTIAILEQTVSSIGYDDFRPETPICLVVGNEIQGVSDDLLGLCDVALDIEMRGHKNSLNVAVAFGIVTYHILNRFKKAPGRLYS